MIRAPNARITILGTSHVSPESVEDIRRYVKGKDCMCIELDAVRYYSLLRGEKRAPPGIFPKILYHIQRWTSRSTKIPPGGDMMEAIRVARRAGIPAYLIDQDFRVTLTKLGTVPFLEKLSVLIPMIIAPHKFDITHVPSKRLVATALKEMRQRAPAMHRVLVEERNFYMASRISQVARVHKRVLVVAGAAHVQGLQKLLKAEGFKVKTV